MDMFFGNIDDKGDLVLHHDEVNHCFRVMRKKAGDRIGVMNGKGLIWEADINEMTSKTGVLSNFQKVISNVLLPYTMHLAVAPTKNAERIEWLLEKSIEIGIHHFTLLYTHRTERKRVNIERLEKIAVAALKQSCQPILPTITECNFKEFVTKRTTQAKFIASCKGFSNIQPISALANTSDIVVMVGPEGDFTDEEYNAALQHEFIPISFGTQRLRTETAALLAVMSRYSLQN
ncbi:MAG: 16S rRNA (uracil(1498)-N(3))-methyltransferase [Bacteroidia bacterium]|nr:16S rRNA (uracil(1498)-N(3))-methyltransferase [Bacteroidia bacterium]